MIRKSYPQITQISQIFDKKKEGNKKMKRNQTQECRTKGRCFALLTLAGLVLFPPTPVLAAHVDWDGGTTETNTVTGGNVDVPANWGPAGGGADGLGGAVPIKTDDVFLNDVQSSTSVVRTVTVNANQMWKSLTVNQSTAPSSGITTNRLNIMSGVTLTLTNAAMLATAGAANAPVVIDLDAGSRLAFGYNGGASATLGSHTVLTGGGAVSNSNGAITLALTVDGTLAGPAIYLGNANRGNTLTLGPDTVVTNAQTWIMDHGSSITTVALNNQIVNPAQWDNNAVTFNVTGGGGACIEAATRTSAPSMDSNYRFVQINLASGNSGQGHVAARFYNNFQNDGGVAGTKEAVYASSWDAGGCGDGSGGHFLLDLNGQDLYVDRFLGMTRFNYKSVQFMNTALDSVSAIRAIDETGDSLSGGSFAVMNGSTLELVGGNWFDTVYNRSVGAYPADSSAVPNSVTGLNVDWTRRWDGAAAGNHAAFNHYLGSGADDGGNASTRYEGTGGTLRIVGGDYSTSGYVLNPIGVSGLIDTTSENAAYPDTVLDTVTIRPNSWQSITNINLTTGSLLAPGHRYTAGTPLQVNGSTIPTGFANYVFYYVVNPAEDMFQLSATPNGTPIIPTNTGNGVYVSDSSGLGNNSALPSLVVAGKTTINGNLALPVLGGAIAVGKGAPVSAPVFQPTLRVGGVLPTTTLVTVDTATDTLTLASGSVVEGSPVYLSAATIPGGLVLGQVYYARNVSGSSFKVAALPGEPAIDITSAGATVSYVKPSASGTAELTVTGDLLVEGRVIEGYIGYSYANANIKMTADTGDGTTVTITTGLNHGLVPGDIITVAGGNVPFRGTFPVKNVISPLIFTYEAAASGDGGNSLYVTYSKPASINVAIQSNAIVRVAGDVAVGGTGRDQNCLATGLGTGFHPMSQFTLNGGSTVTQTVAIVPPVGVFHVGEGTNGVLTGAVANAELATTLTVAGGLDVNGGSAIIGTAAGAGLCLTNGADMRIGAIAGVDIAGALMVGSGSTVDISTGTLNVGSIDIASGGVIDFKSRKVDEGQLTVKGNAVAAVNAAIDAGKIVSSTAALGAWYHAFEDYTSVTVMKGSLIVIR